MGRTIKVDVARDDGQRRWSDRLRRFDRRWLLALLAILIVAWGLTDVRRRARVDERKPWVHRTDVTVYTEAARAFFDGRDPYEVTNPRGWHYLYPPLFALLLAPLALLSYQGQALAWFFVSVALAWGGWRECLRILALVAGTPAAPGEQGPAWPRWLTGLAAAAVAIPVLNCLQRGQVGVLLVYVLLLGFRLLLESRTGWEAARAGVVLALPVVLKLTPAMPVGMLLLMWLGLAAAQRWQAEATLRAMGCGLGLAAGMALFVVLLPGLAIGPGANAQHLRTFTARVMANGDVGEDNNFNLQSMRNQSLANAVYRLGNWQSHLFAGGPDDLLTDDHGKAAGLVMPMDHPLVGRATLGVRLVLVGLLLACGAVAAWRRDMLHMAAVFGMSAALTLVVSPLSWGHHFVMWLPGLLLAPLWLWRQGRGRLALGLSVSAVALVWMHYLALEWVGRAGLLGLGTTVWCLTAMIGLLARGRVAVAKQSASRELSAASAPADLRLAA